MRLFGLPLRSSATFTPTLVVCSPVTFATRVGTVSLDTLRRTLSGAWDFGAVVLALIEVGRPPAVLVSAPR